MFLYNYNLKVMSEHLEGFVGLVEVKMQKDLKGINDKKFTSRGFKIQFFFFCFFEEQKRVLRFTKK